MRLKCCTALQMVKEIERRGEVVGTEAKSAVLAGLALAGRLEEALALYGALRREGAFPEAYSAGILLVCCSCVLLLSVHLNCKY